MRLFSRMTGLLCMMLSCSSFSGEIAYQDYLGESELLSAQDVKANAMINAGCDWNYCFESNCLAVVLKIHYGEGTNDVFRPVVARYVFRGVHEPTRKTVRRADTCYGHVMPSGFCMVGLDSFLFSHGQRQSPKSAFMRLSDSAQTVVDITREVEGRLLHGALSASERAVFPDGGGFVFQCLGNANARGFLWWNNGVGAMLPVRSGLGGYVCLSGGRVLLDASDGGMAEDLQSRRLSARCCRALPCRDADMEPNVYADWKPALSSKVMSLGNDVLGSSAWSIELHGMRALSSNSETGHDFVEGQGVVYDFCRQTIFRLRRNDPGWQAFELGEHFKDDLDRAETVVEIPILHRGSESWYYALLFKCKNLDGSCGHRYRIRIIEVPRRGERFSLWSFPDFNATKKLQPYLARSPGAVHKLPDDSWVFLSNTMTFTNDAIFVQRMTGSRKEMQPLFKPMR